MKGLALAFTSQIRWYKPSTPPDDATAVVAILHTATAVQLQPVIYYSDASEDNAPLWVVYEGCNTGDEYKSSEIVAWASEDETAEIACRAAINLPKQVNRRPNS